MSTKFILLMEFLLRLAAILFGVAGMFLGLVVAVATPYPQGGNEAASAIVGTVLPFLGGLALLAIGVRNTNILK